jgi:predicted PurR-regulated permease PerM
MDPAPRADRNRWPPLTYIAKATVVVALTLYVLGLAQSVLNILILVVIATVLAIGLDPAVRRLERMNMRRGYAVTLIFGGFVLFIVLFAWLVVPPLVHQITGLADDIPRYAQRLGTRNDWVGRYIRDHNVADRVKAYVSDLPSQISRSFSTILGVAGRVTGALFNVVTVAILMIYFMLALPRARNTSAIFFSEERRERAEHVIDQSIEKIGGYVSGNLLTSVICAILAMIALLVLGVPFAVPLAMWAGIADLIPAVGSYLGAVPAIVVAFFQSPLTGILVLTYFLLYQQFENYLLVPKIMQNAVNVSPAAVIVSTLIGGSLFGFAGALLALPVAATIKVIMYDVWLHGRSQEGDELVIEHIEAGQAAEAEAEAEAEVRAEQRRRLLARVRDAIRPKPRATPQRGPGGPPKPEGPPDPPFGPSAGEPPSAESDDPEDGRPQT